MSYFINKYNHTIATSFTKFVVPENGKEPSEIVICGYQNGQPYSGTLSVFDEQGNIKDAFNFKTKNTGISFSNGLLCENGDYLMYGGMARSGNNRLYNILVRLTKKGDIIWSRRLHSDKTRNAVRLIALGGNKYVVAAWHNTSGSTDYIECSLFNGEGHHLRSVRLGNSEDDQMSTIYPWREGFVVVGNTSAGPGWDGFIAYYNQDLELDWKKLLRTGTFDHIEHVTTSPKNDLVLVGTTRQGTSNNNPQTFLARLNGKESSKSTIITRTYNITEREERNRQIIRVKDSYYIVGYNPSPIIRAYVMCVDEKLNLKWIKRFDTKDQLFLNDILLKGKELWLCGNIRTNNTDYRPILIKTDLNLTTCKTEDWGDVSKGEIQMSIKEWEASSSSLTYHVSKIEIQREKLSLEKLELCPPVLEPEPIKDFVIRDRNWLQSPYLNLQAAGSLGQDSTESILLRWLLMGKIGDNHLPKGKLAATTVNYNKPEDYVCVYRASYPFGNRKHIQSFYLGHEGPIFVDNKERLWVYLIGHASIYVYFHNTAQYQAALDIFDPQTQAYQFLAHYGNGLLEIELKDELSFAIEIELSEFTTNLSLQVETYSVEGKKPLAEQFISNRRTFTLEGQMPFRVEGENIRSIQLKMNNGFLGAIHFETYKVFFEEVRSKNGWTGLGRFALTDNDNLAFQRLEPSPNVVNGHWKRFNNGRTVQIQNYKNKWSGLDGLKQGVVDYINLSNDASNPKGFKEIGKIDGKDGLNHFNLLDLLQIAAVDFHIARILGLGHIDDIDSPSEKRYIYMAEYVSKTLEGVDGQKMIQHLYLTTPVSKNEQRLPQRLKPEPIRYGLEVQNGTPQPFQLTNSGGYTPDGQTRYVQLRAKLDRDFSETNGFFQPPTEFSLLNFSAPVLAGIEYKKIGEAKWRPLEIAHHHDFYVGFDKNNPPADFETPVLTFDENSTKPLFIHKELEEGIHQYAFYLITIFARSGPLSDVISTDATQFFKRNTLVPPSIKAHLVQEESPLLLTIRAEQNLLSNLSGDKTLVRVLCKYNHTHEQNYDFADKIEFFFRETKPLEVMGKIVSLHSSSPKLFYVTTSFYKYDSTQETIVPNIPPSQISNFIGGTIVINEKQYIIEEVFNNQSNGDHPSFKVQKLEERQTHEMNGNVISTQDWKSPDSSAVGTLFSAMENMAKPSSWGGNNPLGFKLQIGDNRWTEKIQTFKDDEDENYQLKLRGFWETADITLKSTLGNTRTYEIRFNTFVLGNHSQNGTTEKVQWYKEVVRIPFANKPNQEWKSMEVATLNNAGGALELTIKQSTADDALQTGIGIEINYYPDYLLYLQADNANGFNKNSIFPTSTDEKTTILGARSADSPNNYTSDISTPVKLVADKVSPPKKPQLPSGPLFATPPNFFNKSSYTFKVVFEHEFYQAAFYRADINSILRALYKTETLKEIRAKLSPFTMDEHFTDRWTNLLSFNYTEGVFDTFPLADGTEYAFPNPDNPKIDLNEDEISDFSEDGSILPGDIIELIQEVVWDAFLPLTEQPLYFDNIKKAPYQAIPKKQTIRDSNGDLLSPEHPDFDQAPMAKREDNIVQFTDFTLDGGMGLDTAYCYFAREIGNKLEMGEPSPIAGPIQLVDKSIPSALQIRKVTSQLAKPTLGIPAAVRFEFLKPFAAHRIQKIRVYRCLDSVDSLSVRMMDLLKTVDVSTLDDNNGVLTLIDDFAGEAIIPYGTTLFYRLVGVKMVTYINVSGQSVTQEVPSYPTKALQSSLIDNTNPEPPKLLASGTTVNKELTNLVLTWNKTAYNATYRLLKMTSSGTWHKEYELQSNAETMTFAWTNNLTIQDEDDQAIYHRFKVSVENSSGLMNVEERILTISAL